MDQETYNGIVKVLQRGAGVMAQEYITAFTSVVAELQNRIKAEQEAKQEAQQKDAKVAETKNEKKEG